MRPRIVEFLNDLFQTHFFTYIVPGSVFIYALMLSVLIVLFLKRCARVGLSRYHGAGIALWGSVGAIVGARLFDILQHLRDVVSNPATLLDLNGGLVSFGGYVGGVLAILLYGKYHTIALWSYTDTLASVTGLGPFIGRISCLFNGDDYGSLTTVPWAIKYPKGSFPFIDHLNQGLVDPFQNLSLAVHPVQLYESIAGLFLFLLFTIIWQKNVLKPGALSLLFWVAYGLFRFVIEFYRGDQNRGWVGPLSFGQFMSILIVGTSLILIAYRYQFRLSSARIT